jgi:uncharacterized membrane protein YfcA
MPDTSFLTLGGLFLLAFVAGTIDAMAGGGGLLTVPGLMAAGLDPVSAIATNKSQGIFSSLSAAAYFRKKGKVRFRHHLWPGLMAFAGGVAGAFFLSKVDTHLLKIVVPFLLIAVGVWVWLNPQRVDVPPRKRLTFLVFSLTLVPLIGFYDGFFGPGTGSFFAISGVLALGLRLDEATIRAKIYNFMSNFGGLLFFIFTGHVVWAYGLAMMVGTAMGGVIGARLILKHGTSLIRPVLVIMSFCMSLKLLWDQGLMQKFYNIIRSSF